jgi:methionine-rich copper-binding protein CopC
VAQEVWPVRKGLVTGVAAAAAGLLWLVLASGVAAQDPYERTEPAAGAVLDRAPSRVEVWLEEPPAVAGEAELRVVHNQSGTRVDLGGEPLDPSEPRHLKVLLRPDLGPGKYVVSWAVSGSDNGEIGGSFSFTIADSAQEENDDLVPIALATFGAAAAAAVVGLLAYVLRVQLGLVSPPPPPESQHGSHSESGKSA